MSRNINHDPDSSNPGQRLMSVRVASQFLGVSPRWLYESGIPFVKLGRRRLYRPEDLNAEIRRSMSTAIGRESE